MRPCATTLLTSWLACAALAWGTESLLPNGDFEKGDKGPSGRTFTVWSAKPSRGSFDWSAQAHSGQHAAWLTGLEKAGTEAVRGLL